MKTSKLRDEKEVQDRQQQADVEAQKNLEENLQQLDSRKQELELQEEQMQARLKKILDAVGKHKEELTRVRKEQREMKEKLGNSRFSQLDYLCHYLSVFVRVICPVSTYSAIGLCWSILVLHLFMFPFEVFLIQDIFLPSSYRRLLFLYITGANMKC